MQAKGRLAEHRTSRQRGLPVGMPVRAYRACRVVRVSTVPRPRPTSRGLVVPRVMRFAFAAKGRRTRPSMSRSRATSCLSVAASACRSATCRILTTPPKLGVFRGAVKTSQSDRPMHAVERSSGSLTTAIPGSSLLFSPAIDSIQRAPRAPRPNFIGSRTLTSCSRGSSFGTASSTSRCTAEDSGPTRSMRPRSS